MGVRQLKDQLLHLQAQVQHRRGVLKEHSTDPLESRVFPSRAPSFWFFTETDLSKLLCVGAGEQGVEYDDGLIQIPEKNALKQGRKIPL